VLRGARRAMLQSCACFPPHSTALFRIRLALACSVLSPRRTNLRLRLGCEDEGFLHFLAALLTPDPDRRPTAAQALQHPWLRQELELEPYALPA